MDDRYYDSDTEEISNEEEIKESSFRRTALRKTLRPAWIAIPAVGIGLVLLAMLMVWFWEKPLAEGPEKRQHLLEQRIENLENQVVRLNALDEKWIVLENRNQKLQTSLERIERMETSIHRRLDALRSDVNALKNTSGSASADNPSSSRSEATSAPTASADSAPAKPPAEESPQVHTVQPGETLYSISRQYGVSVEQLRSWNELSDDTIGIGQNLRVR